MSDCIEQFDFVDLFCGAGGSIEGMVAAGGTLRLGANHWDRAIETVSSNHPQADFLCVDINHYDMRYLPRARVLWASVICTEASPAGGRKKKRGQQELAFEEYGHVPNPAWERTRACALDVIRATELWRYDAVVVENVVEFAKDWELYDWWIQGMCQLKPGYNVQVVCANSAHIGDCDNGPAPQWRDRIYMVFTKVGIPLPDLELRPTSWCPKCEGLVEGQQSWKRPDRMRVGKYGQQYVYRCSRAGCGEVVEPLVLPAINAIDLTDVGQRIGDRDKPLAKSTMARIEWGINEFWRPIFATVAGNTFERDGYKRAWPVDGAPLTTQQTTSTTGVACPPIMVKQYGSIDEAKYRSFPAGGSPLGALTTTHSQSLITPPPLMFNANHDDTRVYPAEAAPLPTRSTKLGDGIVWPEPFVTMARNNGRARGVVTEPMATLATGNHHYLTVPPLYVKNYAGNAQPQHLVREVGTDPLGTITTRDHHALVIPYRKGRTRTVGEPLLTLATHDSAALCQAADQVLDPMEAYYRMLRPREAFRAQRFRDDFNVKGNIGEQIAQAGNAVSCNAGQWIGTALAEAFGAAR